MFYILRIKTIALQLQVRRLLSWQDLIGKHDLEIFPKYHAQKYYESELPVMNEGKELKNQREPYVTLEREPRWVSTNKRPIKDKDIKLSICTAYQGMS